MMKDILPDCRLQEPKGAISNNTTGMYWVQIYCGNCGTAGGRVPAENMTYAFWLCNSCWEKNGPIAGTMCVPDEIFWDEIRQECLRKQQKEKGE